MRVYLRAVYSDSVLVMFSVGFHFVVDGRTGNSPETPISLNEGIYLKL